LGTTSQRSRSRGSMSRDKPPLEESAPDRGRRGVRHLRAPRMPPVMRTNESSQVQNRPVRELQPCVRSPGANVYQIAQLMPPASDDEPQYRIKSETEGHLRAAKESELTALTASDRATRPSNESDRADGPRQHARERVRSRAVQCHNCRHRSTFPAS
jgi:hypothetical protein